MTSQSITLMWDPPQDRTHRDGTIIKYQVSCISMDHEIAKLEMANSTNITHLLPHQEYTCCVSVETTNGKSSDNCKTLTTLEEGIRICIAL